MSEHYDPSVYVKINKTDVTSPGIRLYCEQSRERWGLQIRGPLTLADGRVSAQQIIAHARVNRADLEALRAAITEELDSDPRL